MDIQIINCLAGGNAFDTEGQTDHKTISCITVVSCLAGSYEIYIDRKKYMIHAGECFYTPEKAQQTIVHHLRPDGKPLQAQWVYMTVLINNKFDLKKYYDIPCKLPERTSQQICGYISDFVKYASESDLTAKIKRNYLEYAILNALIDCGTPVRFQSLRKLEAAAALIEAQLDTDLSVSAIARAANYSESYLYRLFKDELGMSPQQYIMRQKLAKACDLLIKSDMSVRNISDSLGFCDQFHFSKRFRQEFRCTPTQFRKNYAYFK